MLSRSGVLTWTVSRWNLSSLNGIATSTDGSKIYVTFTGPEFVPLLSGVLELPAFEGSAHH